MHRSAARLFAAALALGASARLARAQGDGPVEIEIPDVVIETNAVAEGRSGDTELDLANIVQSAAKGVTTVQEAPAIVTVITRDEIEDRQLQTLDQIVDTVPGWLRLGAIYSMFPYPLARGELQAAILLQDGLSLFDPYVNVPTVSRTQPLETIKRIELITGPGGVLWGSNSLLGIINVITKDADDVDGVEVGGQLGDGNGDRSMARAYLMAGAPDLLGGRAKLWVHGSFETYLGPGYETPAHLLSAPLPQPNGPNVYGPTERAEPPRSYLFDFSAKLTVGNFQVRTQFPLQERHQALAFRAALNLAGLPDSDVRRSRDNQADYFDRYGVAEYRTRMAGGKAGLSIKAFLIQFARRLEPDLVLQPNDVLPQGVAFDVPFQPFRAGAAADGDAELPGNVRLLYGFEGYHEWQPNNDAGSRQGRGVQGAFDTLDDTSLTRLNLPCPRDLDPVTGQPVIVRKCALTLSFAASRTVLGAYINPQWRPTKKLILDAGGRITWAPPALGLQSYDVTPTFSGTAVYNFISDWHAKLNVAQGFRPPVFNNLVSNGEAVQIDGRDDLAVETTTAGQAEVNARLFKGERAIRELDFRVDYSYTYLQNLIQIIGGRYQNTADRGIHSAELLAKLYVEGGHRLELSYTWLRVNTEDVGAQKAVPENWFNLGAVFNLIDHRLSATSTLRVVGATEDANRLIENRDLAYDDMGRIVDATTRMPTSTVFVGTSELVFDRLPAAADLTAGLLWTPSRSLEVRATVHNAFNARYYQPDAFFNYEPRLEFVPNPAEDFRAYLGATYRY